MQVVKQESYEVGDFVEIRNDLASDIRYGNDTFVKEMKKNLGMPVVISFTDRRGYKLTNCNYTYTPEMIKGKIIFD